MIALYTIAAFTGIALLAYATAKLLEHCEVTDPDEIAAASISIMGTAHEQRSE